MEDEHLILLWEAANGEISNNLGNCLGLPSFSSSHNRDVSEAICLFALHGHLLHCAAWLAVQAWVVWKHGRDNQLALAAPLLWAQLSGWAGRSPPESCSETATVRFLLPAVDVGPSQTSSMSLTISLASREGSAAHQFLHKISVGRKAP